MLEKKPSLQSKSSAKPMMSDKGGQGEKGYLMKKTSVKKEGDEDASPSKRVLGDNIGDDPEGALEEVRQKIAEDPANEENYKLEYQILKKLEMHEELVVSLEKACAVIPSNPYFPTKLAEFHEEHFGYEKAVKSRLAVQALKPDDSSNLKKLAVDYVKSGHFTEAEEIYNKIFALATGTSDPLGHTFFQEMQGAYLSKEERRNIMQFGIKIAGKALNLYPKSITLLEGTARLCKLASDFTKSIEYYEALILIPEAAQNPSIHQWKGELLKLYAKEGYAHKWGDLHASLIENYKTYLETHPADSNAFLQLALQQIQGGYFDDAIISLQSCLQLDDKNIQALYELGRIYVRLNRSEEAIAYYSSIIPQAGDLSNRMKYHRALELCFAELYYKFGSYKEALELYRREENSNYRYIALVCEAMGDDEAALACYNKALEMSPRDAKNYLALAEYYTRRSQWQKSEELANAGLKCPHITKDTNEQTLVVLATAMMKTGRFSEALSVMESAIETSPDLFSMQLRRIKLLLMNDRKAEAKAAGEDLIKRIDKQLSCAPAASNLWTIEGDVASILGRFDLARQAYGEAMKYNALDSDAFRGEGVLAEKYGEYELAIQLYSRYAIMEPLSLATPPLRQKIEQLKKKIGR
ncbi:MAG: tetratricopeptide repeat protein [bacterium]|nr:tetratricopeptide repeat protein [bacterium]